MSLTKEQVDEINSYKAVGMSLSWISRKTNIPVGKIEYLRELGVLVKTRNRTKKDLFCNYRFFQKIDTEEKAYWLGFIYADGSVSDKGSLSINLSTKDRWHLEKFKKHISAEHPVRDGSHIRKENKKMKMKAGIQYYSAICIHSGEMGEDLNKVGVFPRKSLSLDFPTNEQVPEELLNHFIRGYLDGDGYVCYRESFGNGESVSVGFISSDIFCEKLSKFFSNKLNLNPKSIRAHERTSGISLLVYGGKMDFLKIRKYLYDGATVWLERKREKFFMMTDKEFLFDWYKIIYFVLTTENNLIESNLIKKETGMDMRIVVRTMKKMEEMGIIKFIGRERTSLRIFKRTIVKMTDSEARFAIDNLSNKANWDRFVNMGWREPQNSLTHSAEGDKI
jgi:hypothetical protein